MELENELFPNLEISLYSDSILIIGKDLIDLTKALQILLWTALRHNWIIRGGVAYGKHWKEKSDSNLFIVSQALVNAVTLEKNIKHPVIVLSKDISLGTEYWIHLLTSPVVGLPIIHFEENNIINPFNYFWFSSAESKLNGLNIMYPEHSNKYQYLLRLINAMNENHCFVPKNIMEELIGKGVIKQIK